MSEPRLRVLQPPPESDHFTYEQALAAWKKVAADNRVRVLRERGRDAGRAKRENDTGRAARG